MRGNLRSGVSPIAQSGSIPAYAGEPSPSDAYTELERVYPRVCGGTSRRWCIGCWNGGLSPRMRGNLVLKSNVVSGIGSIPAYAGEPGPAASASPIPEVYPRVCGGTGPSFGGNPQGGVYPRVCGGTCQRWPHFLHCQGLSPRMRGNPGPDERYCADCRSIPAYAGEPPVPFRHRAPRPVYPRVCGGTAPGWARRRSSKGLSPRMRGNPCDRAPPAFIIRSIPAYAGEPPQRRRRRLLAAVYPRVCGGTLTLRHCVGTPGCLSPRMRGNPLYPDWRRRGIGSIPAYAGEPAPRCTHIRAW